MFVSVILTTYESPDWLAKVVLGFAAQTHRNFELIVGDDGSGPATAVCLDYLRQETGLALRHVWQPHAGFRKCRILNRAIEAATARYLIFTDGDCIPRSDFVAQHVRLAAPGRFLSGGVVRLPMDLSRRMSPADIASGRALNAGWLKAHGLALGRKLPLLAAKGRLAALCDALTTTRATFNGHNTSAWKHDILRVNGFDERLGYGGLDRELGERLVNAGVRPEQIRHRAVCVHLDHARPYVDPAGVLRNRQIRDDNRRRRAQWTPFGIEQPAEQPVSVPEIAPVQAASAAL